MTIFLANKAYGIIITPWLSPLLWPNCTASKFLDYQIGVAAGTLYAMNPWFAVNKYKSCWTEQGQDPQNITHHPTFLRCANHFWRH